MVDENWPHFTAEEIEALHISGWYKALELGGDRARPGAPLLSTLHKSHFLLVNITTC